ncbi:class III lanthionine synthetase LanKC [Jiangella asiatica]|uniref:non-specific serine/threonine protein kinase n=1 Tax=Jiangella asiatica TaxID=2530372 RepID=A0A4R5DC18_9ACTN|nr:class III lanthionine synthetase LanKC [Jiangella asiatica]TDE09134.1 lantipeptide synthetase [Jiangella asiatica]
MIDQYELYCLADQAFYDAPANTDAGGPDFAIAGRPVPEEWERQASDVWMNYAPREQSLPSQGWKIHVSCGLDAADRVLEAVWHYCVPRGLAFKFLRSRPVMVMFNSKSAFRGSSGKLVTIYPADTAQLELVLKELDQVLHGIDGPYILSDLRYGDGPLFVRYGAFAELHCVDASGERVLAIEDDQGRLVPDVRGPVFACPPWVELPEFLEPHLAARNAVTVEGLPFEIESVVQFSNGGGVYLGRVRSTGERVVLKEGRPLAGLDVAGRDAVARVSHERDILGRLARLSAVPAVRDYFTLGGHHFLVMEFVDGNPLQRLVVDRYPLTHPDPSPETVTAYADWALGMLARVNQAMDAVHGRGVVFGDLHPDNILVAEDGRIVLVDFEVSSFAEADGRSALAHPGYGAPPNRHGIDVDRYALACLFFGLFAPQTTIMLPLHPAKAVQVAELVREIFPVPARTVEAVVGTILGSADDADASTMRELPMPGVASWERVRASMCRAIVESATPGREDRLFPGDIAQFEAGGGINLAYGAAGVLYALARTDAGRFPEYEEWLRAHAAAPARGTGIGFYDGLHGVAHVLDVLGRRQDALDTLRLCLAGDWRSLELGLYSGLAGIGLNLLHFSERTGEREFAAQAADVIDAVAERLGGPEDVPEVSGGDNPRAGLMFGSSGPALLFIRAYERTGDTALLDLAATALRQDLRRCIRDEDGTMQVTQGWRTLPYLDEGSMGIAVVLARYLTHRQDEAFATALDALRRVARAGFFVQPGLFTGRAGIIAGVGMLARTGAETAEPSELPDLVRRLDWHALPYGGGLAFPGNQLLRLSMDLATGTAGVLLALGSALHDRPVFLPFLEPAAPATTTAPSSTPREANRPLADEARKEVRTTTHS